MSKVSEVKVASDGKREGTFKVGVFNLFDADERQAYEELRSRGGDRASGVQIENLQQFKRVITESDGDAQSRREDLYMLVQYWEKSIVGLGVSFGVADVPDPPKEPERAWHLERGSTKR